MTNLLELNDKKLKFSLDEDTGAVTILNKSDHEYGFWLEPTAYEAKYYAKLLLDYAHKLEKEQ